MQAKKILNRKFWPVNVRQIFTEVKYEELAPPLNIRCRNVEFLPGSESKQFPEFLSNTQHPGFHAIKVDVKENKKDYIKHLRTYLDNAIEEFPAILIKGLPITEIEDFQKMTNLLGYKDMTYEGGNGIREKLISNIHSASDEDAKFTIEPHNEMSYVETTPSKIMFCCIQEGATGGESPIAFNKNIMANLDQNIMKGIAEKKIRYYRNLPHEENSNYITWQRTYETKSEEEAEQKMKEQNFNWKWHDNGNLSIWNTVSAMRPHPVTGENIWFNQAHSNHYTYYKYHPKYATQRHLKPWEYHFNCSYGDGEEFEDYVIEHIRSVTWNNAMAVKLEKGDVFLLDNFLCQHSRMAYTGNRRMLVQLLE